MVVVVVVVTVVVGVSDGVVVVVGAELDVVVVTVVVVVARRTTVVVASATPVVMEGALVRAIGSRFSAGEGPVCRVVRCPNQISAATRAPSIAPRATRPCPPSRPSTGRIYRIGPGWSRSLIV